MKREIKNAVIDDVSLSYGDRGFLNCWLHLSYGNSGQGFGGYTLYLPRSWKHHRIESPAGHFLFRVMEVAGVDDWGQLKGRTIRVDCEHNQVHGIGHIVKDDWFYPAKDFAGLAAKPDVLAIHVEQIEWHYTANDLPEPDTTCLMAFDTTDTDEVEIGFHDGTQWCAEDKSIRIHVYAWAYAPAKPQKKGGAK